MIPSDVASRLQVSADATLRPVAPAQEISDKLSGLVAGQKVMAEIQALLPNGTYRALINQRSVTLALPFSAKSGDALELLVTEGLRASLDVEAGGEIAERLVSLYEYIAARLLWANLKNDTAALDECLSLLGEIHSAWALIVPSTQAAA